ncbi:lytic transglycosylase domain-containing protein [Pseudomonas sp. EMN2]|uniref:lytic transglycosylase domain-containing protein n=1 Tax=Pseudomonas sp. EMN2 TaxID=2615212 RepID=UPI00129A6940|nr:lytic transglycosylase domain-containing protein [Pseudomonas sp. EMN2]
MKALSTVLRAWSLCGIIWGAVLAPQSAIAGENVQVHGCLRDAAAYHHVDLQLLRAIAQVESGFNPSAKNLNKNGTGDHGLMQVNDWWLPKLRRFGISTSNLYDACTSAYVGAWILAHSFKQYGYTWRAIGAYNSPNSDKQMIYAEKVNKALQALSAPAAEGIQWK